MTSTRDPCDACPVAPAIERREFLQSVATAVGAMAALPVRFVSGTGRGADKAYPMPASDGVTIDKAESVILARFENRVYAFSLACPHQNTALKWDKGAGRFQCPKHKSRYKPDGSFIDGRATRGLDRFAVKKEGEQLLVNLDALYEEDKQAAAWKAAFVQL